MDWNNTPSTSIYVVPNCGLSIEVAKDADERLSFDNAEPRDGRRYWVVGPKEFTEKYTFSGVMSPIRSVKIPFKAKKSVGIPARATQFAYVYPTNSLAERIDWKKFEPRKLKEHTTESYITDPLLQSTNEFAIPYIGLFGAFAYFDDDCNLVCVNAISPLQTPYMLRLLGPVELADNVYDSLHELNRVCVCTSGIYHEEGFSAYSWVHSDEHLKFETMPHKLAECIGALYFFNDNGSVACFLIEFPNNAFDLERSSRYFPNEILAVTVQAISIMAGFDEGRHLSLTNDDESLNFPKDILTCNTFLQVSSKQTKRIVLKAKYTKDEETKNSELDTASELSLGSKKFSIHESLRARARSGVTNMLIFNARKEDLLQIDEFGWSPLHHACSYNPDFETILLLLALCPEAALLSDNLGRYPIHIACNANPSVQVINALLDADQEKRTLLKQSMFFGKLPIHVACARRCSKEVIQILLDEDRTRSTICTKTFLGYLPLHMALFTKMPDDVIELLLKYETESILMRSLPMPNFTSDSVVNVENGRDIYQYFDGMLPIHIACSNQSSEKIMSMLLDKDKTGETLYKGVKKFRLRDKNSGSSDESLENMLPLHLATKFASSVKIIRLILNKEKRVLEKQTKLLLSRNVYGRCPLHFACQNNDLEVIQTFLDADKMKQTTRCKDSKGLMPIHYIRMDAENSACVLKMLLRAEHTYLTSSASNERKSVHQSGRRNQTLLNHALKVEASDDLLEILLHPEHFNLKTLSSLTLHNLAMRISASDALKRQMIRKLAERINLFFLLVDLYINAFTTIWFLIVETRINERTLTLTHVIVLLDCCAVLAIREAMKLRAGGLKYFQNIFSYFELARLGYLIYTSIILLEIVSFVPEGITLYLSSIMKITGVLVIILCIVSLRSVFLPFATFVGGFILVVRSLLSFIIMTLLFLLIFGFAYHVDRYSPQKAECGTDDSIGSRDCCSSITDCFYAVFNDILAGTDSLESIQDIIYGTYGIIIFLNIFTAIVYEGWSDAKYQAETTFWFYRLEFLAASQSSHRQRTDHVKYMRYINMLPRLRVKDNVQWKSEPFYLVASLQMYKDPHNFFASHIANQIKEAQSFQAELYWTMEEGQHKNGMAKAKHFFQIIFVIMKWISLSILHFLAVILGVVSCGLLWPNHVRVAFVAIGIQIELESKDQYNPFQLWR